MHISLPESLPDRFLEPIEGNQYKADERSVVWRSGCGDWVVKRFGHSEVKQKLTWLIGQHPAQREKRMADRLAEEGLAVCPVAWVGMRGGRGHVVVPWVGESVQRVIADGGLRDERRAAVIDGMAARLGELIRGAWYFRDLQPANMVLTEDGEVVLIDVGSVRKTPSTAKRARMLDLLERTIIAEGGCLADFSEVVEGCGVAV